MDFYIDNLGSSQGNDLSIGNAWGNYLKIDDLGNSVIVSGFPLRSSRSHALCPKLTRPELTGPLSVKFSNLTMLYDTSFDLVGQGDSNGV